MVQRILGDAYEIVPMLLIKARQESGLLQAQVAELIGKPQSFVSKYESAGRRLDVIELLGILKVLKVDSHAFMSQVQFHMNKHSKHSLKS